jgi:hypothetical protein
VAIDRHLPRPLERIDIERSHQPAGERDHIDGRLRLVQAVEQQSLLGRRQRIDVLDLPRTTNRRDQPIEPLLIDPGLNLVSARANVH